MISGLNWVIFLKFCRNSSFTGSVGLIIVPSRSGTCFSSCLVSSLYFSITKNVFFLGTTSFLCPGPLVFTPSNPFPDTAVQKSILPREWRTAIPASLMRDDQLSLVCWFEALNVSKTYYRDFGRVSNGCAGDIPRPLVPCSHSIGSQSFAACW